MNYFDKDYLAFFKKLAANNHKQWFDENRSTYEKIVREPFKSFVSDLIIAIHEEDTSIQIAAKDAIFRINRDIRFSKDKTPYKTFNSALISKTGRKDKAYPGMYLELSPEKLAIYGGVYMPDTQQIQKIRAFLQEHITTWQSLITNSNFKQYFGNIKGEKNKRIPSEFRETASDFPVLYNKQWYYQAELPAKTILQENLIETIVDYYQVSYPVQEFLIETLQ